jgi:hypothetical protein
MIVIVKFRVGALPCKSDTARDAGVCDITSGHPVLDKSKRI